MAHKISDVNYTQRVQTLTAPYFFFSLMIPHEGQGNGRAELLDSTILNTVLQHNQHFAFLFLPIFFCYISSFSLESTRVFDLIVPRWPRFPVLLVGLISSSFSFPFSFVVRGNIIFTLFSSRPALFSFFFPFFLFHLVVCRRRDMGAEAKQRWCEVQIVVVVGCKKRRKKREKMKDRRESFFFVRAGGCAKCANIDFSITRRG